jgi:GDP-L-fucose synthase
MKILVTGGNGFLGKYVVEKLRYVGYKRINVVNSKEIDLRSVSHVSKLFFGYEPQVVIHLAATVGGIGANMLRPADFFYDNMMMGINTIYYSNLVNVRKFIHVGTVCAYPKYCPVPFQESDIWNGYPEETNAPYGIAKKALFVMLDSYRKQYGLNSTILVPCNLYGPHDNFNPESSHVIPAIIKKMVSAVKNGDDTVSCWGTGSATREFLYAENAADAIVKSLDVETDSNPINVGTGEEISIKKLTETIASLVGFNGNIEWDTSKPDGQPRRCLDTSKAKQLLNWTATTPLEAGLKETIDWYRLNNS